MVDTASAQGDLIGYWAFISYSRRDRQWALWLQRRLESFKIEKCLRQKIRSPGLRSDRLCPIFRDDDELGASPDLDSAIRSRIGPGHTRS